MIPPAPYWPKDFAVVKKDGVYHLFYIRRNTTVPETNTETNFGHAVSNDLVHWTQKPAVLPTRPGEWDNQHVWAPSIVEQNGLYTMFYAGVTNQPGLYNTYQRIGIATSTDLDNWTRADPPVFSCDQVPWAYCDSLDVLTGFRDPFVMPDPSTPGRWLMYYTANAAGDSVNEVVGVATSDSLLRTWTDLKPLRITHRSYTGSGVAESPHLFEHDGLWFLLFTANGADPIAYATSPDPLADPAGWTPRGRLGSMLGYYTGSWFASEHLRDGLNDYLLFVSGDRIEEFQMNWTGVATFTLSQPDLFHVVSMSWDADTALTGHTTSLRLDTVNGYNRSASIEVVVTDAQGQSTVLPAAAVGLPSQISITTTPVHFPWVAQIWPPGSRQPMKLAVRTVDQAAITDPPLVVVPDTTVSTVPSFKVSRVFWTADTVVSGSTVRLGVAATAWAEHLIPLAVFTANAKGALNPAPIDSMGIPEALELVADTTYFMWTSRTWPDDQGGPQLTRVVVEDTDDTLLSQPPLVVLPVPGSSPDPGPGSSGYGGDPAGELLFMPPGRRATGSAEFGIRMPQATRVRLDLFDVSGRRIVRLVDGELPRGTTMISWNGRRADGSRALAGVYFARLTTRRVTRTVRTVLLP